MKNKTITLLVLAIVLLVLFVPLCRTLQISDARTGRLVKNFPVKENEEFSITFIHSVNKRPVTDYYRITASHFVVYKSRYDSFGAGMPETSMEGMKLSVGKDGMLELTGINRRLDKPTIFVGTIAQHSLQIKSSDIPLASLAEPGTPLEFSVVRISLLELWKGGFFHE